MADERVVAFVDILGFRSLTERMRDADPAVEAAMLGVLSRIRAFAEVASSATDGKLAGIQVSWLSDSIVVSAPRDSFWDVVFVVGFIACALCADGILLRGGVASGQCHHENGVCFGPALIDAFDLESGAAVYPRIIVDDRLAASECQAVEAVPLAERLAGGYRPRKEYLTHHEDGFFGIDYLSPFFSRRLGFDGPDKFYVDYMSKVSQSVSPQLASATSPSVRMKLKWFERFFNLHAMEAEEGGLNIPRIR